MDKPYSQACDNNRDPIVAVISPWLSDARAVLEIGSGTGQHAVYFGERLPHLIWYTSDVAEHHGGIQAWIDEGAWECAGAVGVGVTDDEWPDVDVDAVFCANSIHINELGGCGGAGYWGWKAAAGWWTYDLYGPFNYGGAYTSDVMRGLMDG